MSITRTSRRRNARGQGTQLRTEIVAAARRLLEGAGGAEAITLRAVARETGVAAPSLYAHFPDRAAILQAVIDDGFGELVETITVARETQSQPVERLEAGIHATLHFAWSRPALFGVMLGRAGSSDPEPRRGAQDPAAISFQLLVDAINACVREGLSSCTDPHLAATAIMAATHGYALVRNQKPTFPWPPEDQLVHHYITALAEIAPTHRL